MFYPPVPGRSMQAWNSSPTYAGYTQASREPAYLPYLPVSATRTEQGYPQSSGETQLPYPPPTAPGQVYIDPKVLVSSIVWPQNKNKGRRATLVGSFDLFATRFQTRLAYENNGCLLKLVFTTRLSRKQSHGTKADIMS